MRLHPGFEVLFVSHPKWFVKEARKAYIFERRNMNDARKLGPFNISFSFIYSFILDTYCKKNKKIENLPYLIEETKEGSFQESSQLQKGNWRSCLMESGPPGKMQRRMITYTWISISLIPYVDKEEEESKTLMQEKKFIYILWKR